MLSDGTAQVWRDLFDLWRQSYTLWPYASHQLFYNMLYKHFPEQRKYDREAVIDALTEAMSMTGESLKVWELGGWDGALACEMITACDGGIEHWRNV